MPCPLELAARGERVAELLGHHACHHRSRSGIRFSKAFTDLFSADLDAPVGAALMGRADRRHSFTGRHIRVMPVLVMLWVATALHPGIRDVSGWFADGPARSFDYATPRAEICRRVQRHQTFCHAGRGLRPAGAGAERAYCPL
jgi:hypothetical protein